MTELLFVVLGKISSGELTIAKSFADSLDKILYRCHFLVNENDLFFVEGDYEVTTLNQTIDKEQNKERVEMLLANNSFNFILLFDVFTVEYAQNWSGVSLAYLKEKQIPIVGLDEYDYSHTGYSLDYYGGLTKKLPPLLEQCEYVIANCPLNKPLKDEKHIRYFRLYENINPLSQAEKYEIRESLGIKPHQKMVFFTLSQWETLNVFRMNTLEKWIQWMPKMLQAYMGECEEDVVVVHVGHGEWNDTDSNNYKYFRALKKETFEKYLLSADLYMGFNIVSITLTKAVLGEVPSLIFQNDKVIHFEKLTQRVAQLPSWYQEMAQEVKIAYPFKASVFGWYHFLKPVLENNLYVESFCTTQFFKVEQTRHILKSMLADDKVRKDVTEKMKQFKAYYYEIPSAAEVMEEIRVREEG